MPVVNDKWQYVLPNTSEVCLLECQAAFKALTSREKFYSHYMSQASWYGALICLFQTSPESPGIFLLLQKLFSAESISSLKEKAKTCDFTDDDFQSFLIYAAGLYGNMGNYKSFGDTKFIPNVTKELLDKLITASAAGKADPEGIKSLWNHVADPMYSLEPREKQLGLGKEGTTTYFSSNCNLADAKAAQEFMTAKNLSAYNTRLFKSEENGNVTYEICLAAVKNSDSGSGDLPDLGVHQFTLKGSSQPVTFKVTRGDYSPLMQHLAENLAKAKEYKANENEGQMLDEYVKCFTEGSITAHKEGSRYWIKNKSPIIETYIGFIESYRDPFGVRGEFEGFVAMVNKEMSARFEQLVNQAEHFLPLLPWPAAYEKDEFLRPDFTSLDVLTFGSSGIPAGINIPNYDDIRQSEGFKNVSLGNVLAAGYKDTKITFLSEADKVLYAKLKIPSFEVQVGLHELLGHGSGKLFVKQADGSFNFDHHNVKHTETGEKISSWYEPNETWDTKFQVISSSYEECRAECVGIYLCLSAEVLSIFGHEGSEADDVIYVNWLNMVRAGLLALEFYAPDTSSWMQAHMQARYGILHVLLEAGEGLVSVDRTMGEDGEPDLLVSLDRSKINSVGKTAIGDFLRKLQVYKSTADYKSGKQLYDRYTNVSENMLSLRDIVLKRKQPRKMFVQCHTVIKDDDIDLVSFESSPEGLIQSFVTRFPQSCGIHAELKELWEKDAAHFS
ncbi:hypothetical protein NP493_20g08016 [Ridgeia piscesae]|uniref:Dipeptidyl peptidase 3 n=1 Tax=Ridgeia piscesae TaxID=27915 RepID=A0AAD9PDW5_RIDPI|nr:hypothetical protein NP493_20g08016 [Ridgeia piscesae]